MYLCCITLKINRLTFAMESHCTLCEVGTEFLYVPYIKCVFLVLTVFNVLATKTCMTY